MNKLMVAALAALFLSAFGVVYAASDTVMLVTDKTSVDAETASAAAAKAGIPVLVLENGVLTDSIRAELTAQAFKNVVLVGGPAVVKPEVETELRTNGYNVVRLWGFERTGTAVEVARYFWPEGSGCAVLVDDTKSSDADSDRQRSASNFAARYSCAFIPVPEGTVPAEVLSMLQELGVKEVHFVGKRTYTEVRDKLKEFKLREIVGDDDSVENEVEDELLNTTNRTRPIKIVIVATPDWKAAIAIGANPNAHAVVRHISSEDQVDALIAVLKEKNITNVTVVGTPDLAQKIADKITAAGIGVNVVSGDKASDIARELWKKAKTEWNQRKTEDDAIKLRYRLKIKVFLENQTNETIARLDAAIAELEAIDTADSAVAKAAIEAAKARITEVKNLILAGNYESAQRLLFELKLKADERKFELRDKLKIRIEDEVDDEENSLDEAEAKNNRMLVEAEGVLTEVRSRCANSDIVDSIIAKAKTLRTRLQEAKTNGQLGEASEQLVQVRELTQIAKSIGEVCRKRGDLPTAIREIREVKEVEEKTMMERTEPKEFTVEITNEGFSPRLLTILKGDTVKWVNTAGTSRRPASAFHPEHKAYPGSDIAKCSDPEEKLKIFDACDNVDQGESYSFTFDQVGEWKYHDHNNPVVNGVIAVRDKA